MFKWDSELQPMLDGQCDDPNNDFLLITKIKNQKPILHDPKKIKNERERERTRSPFL